jgi:hypothetical protein
MNAVITQHLEALGVYSPQNHTMISDVVSIVSMNSIIRVDSDVMITTKYEKEKIYLTFYNVMALDPQKVSIVTNELKNNLFDLRYYPNDSQLEVIMWPHEDGVKDRSFVKKKKVYKSPKGNRTFSEWKGNKVLPDKCDQILRHIAVKVINMKSTMPSDLDMEITLKNNQNNVWTVEQSFKNVDKVHLSFIEFLKVEFGSYIRSYRMSSNKDSNLVFTLEVDLSKGITSPPSRVPDKHRAPTVKRNSTPSASNDSTATKTMGKKRRHREEEEFISDVLGCEDPEEEEEEGEEIFVPTKKQKTTRTTIRSLLSFLPFFSS